MTEVEKRKVVGSNGVTRHVPISYNKKDGRAVTISVSVKENTAGLLNQRAQELNVSKSKLVDKILRKGLKK